MIDFIDLIAQDHATSRLNGLKMIECEGCGHVYVYERRVKATSSVSVSSGCGKKVLQARADDLAQWVYRVYDDPVPCPKCRILQAEMLHDLRRKHAKNDTDLIQIVSTLGAIALPIGLVMVLLLVLGAPGLNYDPMMAGCVVLAGLSALLLSVPFRLKRQRIMRLESNALEFRSEVQAGRELLRRNTDCLPVLRGQVIQIDQEFLAHAPRSGITSLQQKRKRLMRIIRAIVDSPDDEPISESDVSPAGRHLQDRS